jgi:methylmalonyl-CoA decarboxylase
VPLAIANVEGELGFITLDHKEKRNALSVQLMEEINTALEEFKRRHVRVAILKSRPGTKVWSAGHDVSELPESRRDPLGWDDPLPHLIRDIEMFPAPVITMIEGTVWGGACELAFACDLIAAGPDASFAVTPAKIGVPYNVSGMVTFMNATS